MTDANAQEQLPRDWTSIDRLLTERCSYLQEDEEYELGLSELLADLNQYYPEITDQTLVYWRTVHILEPREAKKGARKVLLYPPDQVRRAHLAAILTQDHYNLKPQVVAGAVSAWFAKGSSRPPEYAVDLSETYRAELMLRGRLLGVIVSMATGKTKPPADCILICRRLPDGSRAQPEGDGFLVKRYPEEDVRRSFDPEGMLIGLTKDSDDPEIISVVGRPDEIASIATGRQYFALQVILGDPYPAAEIIVAPRVGAQRVALHLRAAEEIGKLLLTLESSERRLLGRLLRYVFDVVIGFRRRLETDDPRHRIPKSADLLSVLMTTVLMAAPDRWEYSAFLAPASGEFLVTVAHSPAYPLDMKGSVQGLKPREHLESWVYQNAEPVIVETPGEISADGAITTTESPQAFAILPGFAGGEVRGVLYVGAGEPRFPERCSFSPCEISLLQMLASIIAEAYTRERLASTAQLVSVAPELAVPLLEERDLRAQLLSILGDEVEPAFKKGDPNRRLSGEYLVLVMVRVVGISNPKALQWFISRIACRMEQFARSHTAHYMGSEAGSFSTYRLGEDQLASVLGRVHNDPRDKHSLLYAKLEPLTHLIEGVRVLVWRLYYDYDRLGRQLQANRTVHDGGAGQWIEYIVGGVKKTFATVEYLTSAIDHMGRGQYEQAARELEEARLRDSDSSYILRHLTQAYYRLGKYARAIGVGQETIDADREEHGDYSGSHFWLGRVLAAAGEHDEGLNHLRIAVGLSEAPMYVTEYIESLLRYNKTDSYPRALELIDSVLDRGQLEGKERAWLYALKGEVVGELGRSRDAEQSLEMAVSYDPDNRALRRMLDRWQLQSQTEPQRIRE